MLVSLVLAKVKRQKCCVTDSLGLGMVLVWAQQSIFAFSNINSSVKVQTQTTAHHWIYTVYTLLSTNIQPYRHTPIQTPLVDTHSLPPESGWELASDARYYIICVLYAIYSEARFQGSPNGGPQARSGPGMANIWPLGKHNWRPLPDIICDVHAIYS